MRELQTLGYGVWGIGFGENPILPCHGENTELQGTDYLARGDESCGDGLYSNQELSQRRTLRDSFSNSESGSFYSSEYSRRLWSQKQSRISKLFIYCKRFFNRNRDSFATIGKDRLFDQGTDERIAKTVEYRGQAVNGITQISHTPYPIPHTLKNKFAYRRGFGLLEVMAAAVVLAFMLIGLSVLQKGNRESIIRVRARDNATIIAQDIIDSLSARGSASIEKGCYEPPNLPDDYPPDPLSEDGNCDERENLFKERNFLSNTGEVNAIDAVVEYYVTVKVEEEEDDDDNPRVASYETDFTKSQSPTDPDRIILKHNLTKRVDVSVNWKFKNNYQSIVVSSLLK